MQITSSKVMANGTASAAHPSTQVARPSTPSQPAKPVASQDSSAAISLAVTQINSGKLDEADKLLTGIINGTDAKAPNLGAHVARGTARALQRELQGQDATCILALFANECQPEVSELEKGF